MNNDEKKSPRGAPPTPVMDSPVFDDEHFFMRDMMQQLRFHGRKPEHPGGFLDRCYLVPLKISQSRLAGELKISRRRVNEIVKGRRAITADTALRLASFFHTTPMFWLEKQQLWELYQVGRNTD